MLKWIENCPKNVTLLRGNHEEMFAEYVELMLMLDGDENLGTDFLSNADARALYDSVLYFLDRNSAGYTENFEDVKGSFDTIEEFYLYARGEGLRGGIPHGMIISGHTPTLADDKFAYNGGNVYRHYDEQRDCVFYDIDCGCAFRSINSDAKLACIRLDDEQIFYI